MIPISFDVILIFDAFSEMKFGCVFLVLMSSALLLDATNHRTGMAFRVPTPDVSVVDLTFTAEKADGVGWSRRREHTWELYHWNTWWEKSEKGDILVNDNNAMYFLVIEEFWYTVCTRMCDLMLSRCKSDNGKVLIFFFCKLLSCSARTPPLRRLMLCWRRPLRPTWRSGLIKWWRCFTHASL